MQFLHKWRLLALASLETEVPDSAAKDSKGRLASATSSDSTPEASIRREEAGGSNSSKRKGLLARFKSTTLKLFGRTSSLPAGNAAPPAAGEAATRPLASSPSSSAPLVTAGTSSLSTRDSSGSTAGIRKDSSAKGSPKTSPGTTSALEVLPISRPASAQTAARNGAEPRDASPRLQVPASGPAVAGAGKSGDGVERATGVGQEAKVGEGKGPRLPKTSSPLATGPSSVGQTLPATRMKAPLRAEEVAAAAGAVNFSQSAGPTLATESNKGPKTPVAFGSSVARGGGVIKDLKEVGGMGKGSGPVSRREPPLKGVGERAETVTSPSSAQTKAKGGAAIGNGSTKSPLVREGSKTPSAGRSSGSPLTQIGGRGDGSSTEEATKPAASATPTGSQEGRSAGFVR